MAAYDGYKKSNKIRDEKEDIVNGNRMRRILDSYEQKPKMKRHLSNNEESVEDNGEWIQVNSKRKVQKCEVNQRNQLSDFDEEDYDERLVNKVLTKKNHTTRIISNSNITTASSIERSKSINKQHINNVRYSSDDDGQNSSEISYQALKYASDNSLAPVKIVCEPKLQKQNQGMAVIQQLFKYIEVDFRRNYPHLGTKALGFEHWWINRNEDLMGITKCIDMYIYLCDSKHYPLSINNIQLKPILPKHLPAQLSVLIKFVDNYISVDEVKTELEGQFTEIFAIVDIFGSKNMRNRHVRMDLASKSEYENILNSGKVSIFGQLYDAYEFLSPPKLLICSKCNSPGHTKKNCRCDIEVCRRCGSDRLNGDHINCIIKSHHCEDEHLSTNYVCPILTQYRKDLVAELKRRPDLIPEDVQLFIPVIEIVPPIHQTIIALGRVIEMDNGDNDNESIQLNYNKILHELSKTSEMVLDRTDLLQKHHEKLMGVRKKQNELLVTSLVEISDTENV
ncbi:unnamed protein product [Didymodactylos carnosus]|uniref:CCHC-type domain-containing protein n=1 Tax=Didymodactylos carnosus TaxID=1234261 RepID=A0A8S2HBM6_9BILA|nr:unnamed protein product [Didymodactylos carnosus]CAF3602434.1 unnamed protein product [Didymodactylos carnosus]